MKIFRIPRYYFVVFTCLYFHIWSITPFINVENRFFSKQGLGNAVSTASSGFGPGPILVPSHQRRPPVQYIKRFAYFCVLLFPMLYSTIVLVLSCRLQSHRLLPGNKYRLGSLEKTCKWVAKKNVTWAGFEPAPYGTQAQCSTDWAIAPLV